MRSKICLMPNLTSTFAIARFIIGFNLEQIQFLVTALVLLTMDIVIKNIQFVLFE